MSRKVNMKGFKFLNCSKTFWVRVNQLIAQASLLENKLTSFLFHFWWIHQNITRCYYLTHIACLSKVTPRIHAVLAFLDCFMIANLLKSNSWKAHTVFITGCVLWIRKQIICVAQATNLGWGREISLLSMSTSFNFYLGILCFLTGFIKWLNLKVESASV